MKLPYLLLGRMSLRPALGLAAVLLAAAAAPAQTITTLRPFAGPPLDGDSISAPLVQASDGTIFGVTAAGGANNSGTIFKVQPDGSGYQIVFSFPAGTSRTARYAFIQGRDGTLFGTLRGQNQTDGSQLSGALYRINPDGTGYAIIHIFAPTSAAAFGTDGMDPGGGLVQGADGNLYGLTTSGSVTSTARDDSRGTVWRCAPDGSGYRVIFSFNGGQFGTNGSSPTTLIQGRDGNLYGTAINGGANATASSSPGVVFTLRTDGSGFSLLHSFSDQAGTPVSPQSPLVHAADGFLYGTTAGGRGNSTSAAGAVFKIRPDGSGFQVVYSFVNSTSPTAISPRESFFQGIDGSLYGRTNQGGVNNRGVIYKVRTDGTGFKVITTNPGFVGYHALLQGADGALYGPAATNANPVVNQLIRVVEAPGLEITQQPRSQTIAPGGSVTLTVTVPGATTYQWRRNGTNIVGATTAAYTLASLTTAANATYSVVVGNGTDSVTSAGAVLLVETPNPGRLINLSVRTSAGTGAQTLIAGFVVGGTGSKQVLVRAIGPTLGVFGVTGALADPQLGLFNASSTQIATNTVWGGGATLTNAFAAVGAFALGATSRDAALLSPLTASGASGYSAQVVSASGGTGVALVEAYDADGATSTTRFINLSARTVAGTGAQTLIAGFVLSGNVPRTLLIRGVGPGLNQFGVTGTLANPRLELHTTINNVDTTVATNTGWAGSPALAAAFTQVGAFPLPATSADAALLLTLAPGSYTAQVAGVGGTTGVALVEVYEVP